MRVRLESGARDIVLEGAPLGSGGEASIYVLPDAPQFVAKIYYKPKPEHGLKLAAMIAAPPDDPMAGSGHVSIAWPSERVLEADCSAAPKVVGYVMPRVEQVRLIQEFYNPKSRLQVCPLFHYGYLLRTARNLSAAVRALHERRYVVGDLNESNLLVTNQALVTLVDTDSFQVPAPERTFRCPVGKPEYTPSELQGSRFTEIDRGAEHDAFGLAALIFQLLMQGIHPFTGLYTGAGEPSPIPKRIAAGHWPYARDREVPFKPSPIAPPWEVLPPGVQELMRCTFEEGHSHPERRPTASEWQRAIHDAEKELTNCPANAQHIHHRSLSACPWCALTRQQGRDPFPAHVLTSLPKVTEPAETTSPTQIRTTQPTVTLHTEEVPTLIPVLEQAEPPFLQRTGQKLTEINYLRVAKWLAAGVGFVLAAAAVAYGSWKLTHRPRTLPRPVAQNPAQPEEPEPNDALPAVPDRPKPEPPPDPRPFLPVKRTDLADGELVRFEGHTYAVTSVAFLPAGFEGTPGERRVLSTSADRTMRLWAADTGRELRRFEGHRASLLCLAVSADGKRALTGSADSSARVWNLTSGESTPLEGHGSPVTCVALSADAKLALTGSSDETLRCWDVQARRERWSRQAHPGGVLGAAISRDGRLGLSTGRDGIVQSWNLETGEPIAKIAGSKYGVRSGVFCSDAKQVLFGNWDVAEGVRLGNLSTGDVQKFKGRTNWVNSVAVARDGRRALSGDWSNTVRLWDMTSGRELCALAGHAGHVESVAFSPDGRFALSGSVDRTVRLWDLSNAPDKPPPDKVTPLPMPTRPPDVPPMVEVKAFAELRTLNGHTGSVDAVAIAPDGRHVYSASARDRSIRVWNFDNGQEIRKLTGMDTLVRAYLSQDGQRAFTLHQDSAAWYLWDVETGKLLHKVNPQTTKRPLPPVGLSMALAGDGRRALSVAFDRVTMWDLTSGKALRVFNRNFTIDYLKTPALSSDGKLALFHAVNRLALWDMNAEKEIAAIEGDKPDPAGALFNRGFTIALLSPDGQRVLAGYPDKLTLYDAATGKSLRTIDGQQDQNLSAVFSPDGRHILSAGRGLHLWNAQTGALVRRYEAQRSIVVSLAFSKDGRYAVSGGFDHSVRLWEMPATVHVKPER